MGRAPANSPAKAPPLRRAKALSDLREPYIATDPAGRAQKKTLIDTETLTGKTGAADEGGIEGGEGGAAAVNEGAEENCAY